MRRSTLLASAAIAAGLALPSSAAGTAVVVTDATGDANFSGLHGQSLPASHAPLDITKVTFDTVKAKVAGKLVANAIKITISMAEPPSTTPTSSYGITGVHTVCGNLRLQIYYGESGPTTYGDLAACGTNTDPTATNPEQFAIDFSPKIEGKDLVLQIPLKTLPKEFKVGTSVTDITAYTSTAEFLVAGYQPTDFEPTAGVDTVTATVPWKIA